MNILQIGCNDGNDHVLSFVKQYVKQVKKLVLVDANANAMRLCKETYSKSCFSNIDITYLVSGIVDYDTDYIDIYIPNNNEVSEHASVNFKHLTEHFHHDINTMRVPAITINGLLEKHNLFELDRLYIDTEGLDTLLIQSLDLEKFKVKYIYYEHSHSEGPFKTNGINYEKCQEKLLNHHYDIKLAGNNTIACLT